MNDLRCPRCTRYGPPSLTWKQATNGIRHLGAYCKKCSTWIQWVPQTPEWTEHVTEHPRDILSAQLDLFCEGVQ